MPNDSRQNITALKDGVLSSPPCEDVKRLSPCTHEEADTRLILHLAHAKEKSYKRFIIRTADTDVDVLAVSCIQFIEAEEIWIAFGTGRNFRYTKAHDIAKSLGAEKAHVLPLFQLVIAKARNTPGILGWRMMTLM